MIDPAVQPPLDGIEPSRHTSSVPARPTPTAELRGWCPTCGKYPKCDEKTGLMRHHHYHRSDAQGREGRCPGTKTPPQKYQWLDLERIR